MQLELEIQLISDATFARGDGMGGVVDTEVEHDPDTGLPFIRGRVLKGLLTEECANILFAAQTSRGLARLSTAANYLFGGPGSDVFANGHLRVGAASLPAEFIKAVRTDVKAKRLQTEDVLMAFTDIRRQTSVAESGVPEEGSLRAVRVVLRNTVFVAPLTLDEPTDTALLNDAQALLAACALTTRRGGLGRNRGRGRLCINLRGTASQSLDLVKTIKWFELLVKGGVPA